MLNAQLKFWVPFFDGKSWIKNSTNFPASAGFGDYGGLPASEDYSDGFPANDKDSDGFPANDNDNDGFPASLKRRITHGDDHFKR